MRRFINIVTEADLPMDNASRMKRARQMGFTTPAFHGTNAEFNEFDMEAGKGNHSGFAPFFADKKAESKGYGKKVLEVLLRIRKPLIIPSTWRQMPEEYETLDPEIYKLITGGKLPADTKRERYLIARDAIEQTMDHHYELTGNYDRKAIWRGIYARLRSAGYDAIIWPDTPADHSNEHYKKIVMLDMAGIRLTSAAFDPAKAESTDLRA